MDEDIFCGCGRGPDIDLNDECILTDWVEGEFGWTCPECHREQTELDEQFDSQAIPSALDLVTNLVKSIDSSLSPEEAVKVAKHITRNQK